MVDVTKSNEELIAEAMESTGASDLERELAVRLSDALDEIDALTVELVAMRGAQPIRELAA